MEYRLYPARRKDPHVKPNYQYEKRQRELEKKKKKAEKEQKKAASGGTPQAPDAVAPPDKAAS